ncbi:LSU ribosomal protein L25p [hydrothermal vent metagenome]|uniref:LSU ribosomal protein L25p n=1 Tax=hydrothermal vent metagenome TaxID=652676 RepID=A0A3B0VLQ9_9ZZZZ
MITLTVEKRDATMRAKKIREEGNIPAVVYGPKQETVSVMLPRKEFEIAFNESGESSVIELSGLGSPMSVLVYDVDLDPVTSIPRHADFYAIEKGAKVEVAIPIVFIGEAPAVKSGANLVKVLREIEVEAEAANLPHTIEVDLSVLENVDDQIHAKDVVLPEGVVLITEPNEMVALAQETIEEEETEEATESPDIDSIEVEKKGKQEEESSE